VEPLEVGGVGQHHPQQVIVFARHEIALHDLRHAACRLFKGVQMRLFLALQRDIDEHVHRTPRLLLIDQKRCTPR